MAASEFQKAAPAKDAEIQGLKAKLGAGEVARKLAVAEALSAIEKERDVLASELVRAKHDNQAASELAEVKRTNELQTAAAVKDAEIQGLKATLDAIEVAKKLAITGAVGLVEKDRDELKSGLARLKLEKQLAETSLKDKYETQLRDRDGEIERLRDMKARLSTKMVGETLEQHCETEFNRVRAMAFPKAYFEKDNDASTGFKGDYIFKDSDEIGTEIVSIMFWINTKFDALYERSKRMADSLERNALYRKMDRIVFTYAPVMCIYICNAPPSVSRGCKAMCRTPST